MIGEPKFVQIVHMTKMATAPIYWKIFKYLLLWNHKAIGFGTWYVALGM